MAAAVRKALREADGAVGKMGARAAGALGLLKKRIA
jgi:hypothetical protein